MKSPFHRDSEVDHPGIVGARWWNKSVVESASTQGRRVALLVLGASVVGVMGLCTLGIVGAASGVGGDDAKDEQRQSLKLQQEFGWKFDVPTLSLSYPWGYATTEGRLALATIVDDLDPARSDLAPYYMPTLFQSPEALPKVIFPDGSNASMQPIAQGLRPVESPQMKDAVLRGRALGSALVGAVPPVAVIVDLDGPEAVALAAGAAATHDVVFLFDNWPHPNGVVPAHRTLGAAVHHRKDLLEAKAKRPPTAPPMFVLDRQRLAPYVDDPNKFDNRYAAKLPPASALQGLGIKRVLYVAPLGASPVHMSDLEQPFAAYRQAGIDVRALALDAFTVLNGEAWFGETKQQHAAFLSSYGWGDAPAGSDATPPSINDFARRWQAPTVASVDPKLTALGVTTVAVALGTGYVIGRTGTWNRVPSGSYGGG